MRPIVGILGAQMNHADNQFIDSRFEYVQDVNIAAIETAGGLPMILPIAKMDLKDLVSEYVNRIDAVFLIGGEDSDSQLYGEQPDPLLGEIDQQRDLFELAIYHQAREQHKPILGICRGMQLINIAEGGNLYQDIKLARIDQPLKHDQQPTVVTAETQQIKIQANSWLRPLLGDKHQVNSVHHQIVHQLAPTLQVAANSADGVVEAIESQDHEVYGVQFHPEWLTKTDPAMQTIFDWFVKQV
ncbi:glutamine amidotransferase [Paucilactobacillus hokkaidonensis JCM 18461]|uniref:Glutamine amidotransferase n=2 Tax=Paucilactobacillus hokkaidonensis TaxID=1193095 RepID=A0A0A1GV98_9LACO|nr:gamma-glutamyl-gamma-aminobutyrate hydrolase family protein [Paucilactobacillus hokkaidonensis]BAP84768.1 glutamine amidotransferase [Paucilactobacillus hokkaidonensis JCM 18461]